MSAIKFRIYVVLIGAMITIAGTRALATCNTGCNFGSPWQCYGVTGDPDCGPTQVCEQDICEVIGCGNNNRFTFCVGSEYQCQIRVCSWDVGCGCSN
jgi:hypothetical protein